MNELLNEDLLNLVFDEHKRMISDIGTVHFLTFIISFIILMFILEELWDCFENRFTYMEHEIEVHIESLKAELDIREGDDVIRVDKLVRKFVSKQDKLY